MMDWQKEQDEVYGNNGRARRRNANYESLGFQLPADATARPAVVEEPTPLLPPSYPFIDLLPPEILLILQDDVSAPAPPPSLEPIIEGLQALLPFVREALKSLRCWDSGWEEILVHHRVEACKAKFVVKGGMGDGQRVSCWTGRGMYGSWEWEEGIGLWVSLSLISSNACKDEVLALTIF
jgi:hypothetical protein